MAPQVLEQLPLCSAEELAEVRRRLSSTRSGRSAGMCGFSVNAGPSASRMGFGLFGLDREHPPGTQAHFRAISHNQEPLVLHMDVVLTCCRLDDDGPPHSSLSYRTSYFFLGWLVSWANECNGDGARRPAEPIRVRGKYSCDDHIGHVQLEPEPQVLLGLRQWVAALQPGQHRTVIGDLLPSDLHPQHEFELEIERLDISIGWLDCRLAVYGERQPWLGDGINELCCHVQIKELVMPETTWACRTPTVLRLNYNLKSNRGSLSLPVSNTL